MRPLSTTILPFFLGGAVLGSVVVPAAVLAANATSTPSVSSITSPHTKSGRGLGRMNPPHLEKLSTILGISISDLQARLAAGQTVEQIAQTMGITKEQLQTKMLEHMKTHLQQLVSDGKLTQAQADQQLKEMTERPFPPFGAKRGPGMKDTQHMTDLAKALGLSETDLQSRLSQGKTIDQIITDLGMTKEQLHTKMTEELRAHLQEEVSAGKLTQAQADQRLQDMTNRGPGMKHREHKADRGQHKGWMK